ncbi:MAG: zinc-binding dehydrogenase, partial [Acidobacteriota bacterium]|nr:zinc-binding dehydrogenase [Acidobacteriota bacterium]
MLAVLPDSEGTPRLGQVPDPQPAAGEVLVEVAATALNRVDLMQLQGLYPPPPGESDIPGLECAGRVSAVGVGVSDDWLGRPVMALLGGGGHAQRVAIPEGQLMPLPEGWSMEQGAAVPEVALTAWTNLVAEGRLEAGETVLISGAASGVGSFAVQLAKALDARVLVAGRTLSRLETLLPLGAEACVVLGEDLPQRVRELTAGSGADVVLELVGGEHLPRNLKALAPRGRLVLV